MKIFMVDVVIVRLVLPLAGFIFALRGILALVGVEGLPGGSDTTEAATFQLLLGIAALVVSHIYWCLPPEKDFFSPDKRR